MSYPSVAMSNVGINLRAAPIEPSWILSGTPLARNALIARSPDGTADTLVWDCSPGEFVWHYHAEETIHFLEGSVLLDDGTGPRRVGAGDVIVIPAGAKVHWIVEQHVRKLAIFRHNLPKPLAMLIKVARAAKQALRGGGGMGSAVPSMTFQGEPQLQ